MERPDAADLNETVDQARRRPASTEVATQAAPMRLDLSGLGSWAPLRPTTPPYDRHVQRRANVDDLTSLIPLIRDFYDIDRHPYDESRVTRALGPLLTNDEFGQVWVVETDERLLGYAVVTWSYSLESGGRDCILDEIYVSSRSAGLGTTLLAAAMHGASLCGATAAFLETEAHNDRVRSFYARNGFAVQDSVWMNRTLDPPSL